MATYQSLQSNTSDNTGTLTITKPTSLAVGDLMLAGIWTDRDGGASAGITTPSGWTLQEGIDPIANGNSYLGVYSKIADSADVSASDFTWNGTGSTTQMHMLGVILRITNFASFGGDASAGTGSNTTTLTLTGFTPSPAVASSLYVAFASRSFAASPGQVTSVAMATSNPTWTEQTEITVNGSTTDSTFAVYTATRTETTATGDFTITYATTDNTRSAGVALCLTPVVNGSENVAEVVNYAIASSPAIPQDIAVEGTDPSIISGQPTVWTTTTKS